MLELVFTTGLLGLSVGLFVVSGGTRLKAKPGVDALAAALANDLGQARLLAMRQSSPVAVMFPCDGNRPHSASLYQLEGLTNPHVSRSHNFAGDFPGFCFFQGNWSGSETSDPLVAGTKWADFNVANWLPDPRKKDCALIFMPDGTVRGTRAGAGLPQFDGEYHIAVSAGVSYSGDTLTGAGETDTVCINGGGAIRIESGLTGSSLPTVGTFASSSPPSAPVLQTQLGHAVGGPKGNSSLPSPADASNPTTIPPDGYATVTAFAVDDNQSGERLYCRWNVVPPSGRGLGVFSIPLDANKGAAMDFNPKATVIEGGADFVKPAYQSSYQWHPPADAEPGDVFNLQLFLQDQATGVWSPVGIAKPVKIAPYGAILFAYAKGGESNLYRMNPSGTGKRRFHVFPSTPEEPKDYHESNPSISANGNRLSFLCTDRPGVPAGCKDVFMTDRNGLTCLQITKGLKCEAACLSPDGSHVAIKHLVGSQYQLCVVPVAPMTTGIPTPLPTDDPEGMIFEGITNASGFNLNVYREERLAWASNNKIYFAKTFPNHVADPPDDADGPNQIGPHPFLVEINVNGDGSYVSGPTNSFPNSYHYGTWAAAWSPFSDIIFRTVDGSENQGDPLLKLYLPGWSRDSMGSPGFHDTQPAPYLEGSGAGTEALLLVRSSASDPNQNRQICRLPRGATTDGQINSITPELTTGNATCPIYLR